MKIDKISIENIRGISKKIELDLKGENLVIYGPNGTGKSAIVDGIEFLFTGSISRLKGTGTRDISINKHGTHIDSKPEKAHVKAEVIIDGIQEPVILERNIGSKKLKCSNRTDPLVSKTLNILEKGQFKLSRIDILRFIMLESRERSKEIQEILNLIKLEELRTYLQTISNDAKREAENTKQIREGIEKSLLMLLGIKEYKEEEVLSSINSLRAKFNGEQINSIDPSEIKKGISIKDLDLGSKSNSEKLKRALDEVEIILTNSEKENENEVVIDSIDRQTKDSDKDLSEEEHLTISEIVSHIEHLINRINENEKSSQEIKKQKLIELGLEMLDESNECPLCETSWDSNELRTLLNIKLESLKEIKAIITDIGIKREYIKTEINSLRKNLYILKDGLIEIGQDSFKEIFEEWINNLKLWDEFVEKDLWDKLYFAKPKELSLGNKFWDEKRNEAEIAIRNFDELEMTVENWDKLTNIETKQREYITSNEKCIKSEEFADKTDTLLKEFTRSKDDELNTLYKKIGGDFIRFYTFLHEEDEKFFNAELEPKGPGLDFKVNFHNKGSFNPRALHSDGHQDSMGLCLFLALCKKASEESVKVIILDDVVISIDTQHRKKYVNY